MEEKFELKWVTYNFIFHPFGDILWHLFMGILVGGSLIYAILTTDYWLLVVSIIGIFFFFHPIFYKPHVLKIVINNDGVFINDRRYPWNSFLGFEVFSNGIRSYIYFISQRTIGFGFDIPIEEFFISIEDIKEKLNIYLDEYQNSIPLIHRIYRYIFV